ncbi:hypothetical protein [Pasteuria penetrans]|uniref:hypothetical protein n=1 Tax=Pasteuria penetrans TaxID=86005 RepID=UPI00165B5E5B|nr:hypothetical protein [Pasteuria penetrans]
MVMCETIMYGSRGLSRKVGFVLIVVMNLLFIRGVVNCRVVPDNIRIMNNCQGAMLMGQ